MECVAKYLFQRFLEDFFSCKRDMAAQLGVSYDKLKDVWLSDRLTKGTMDAMDRLIYYCAKNKIALDEYIKECPR